MKITKVYTKTGDEGTAVYAVQLKAEYTIQY